MGRDHHDARSLGKDIGHIHLELSSSGGLRETHAQKWLAARGIISAEEVSYVMTIEVFGTAVDKEGNGDQICMNGII
jgi:hypothetical protein